MSQNEIAAPELLAGAYRDFNARNLDAVLARLHPQVVWANGMEGGHVRGREAVRAYWTRQWAILDPHVEPTVIQQEPSGRWVVEVHQIVHDLQGILLTDATVCHVYTFRGAQIERMDIQNRSNDRP